MSAPDRQAHWQTFTPPRLRRKSVGIKTVPQYRLNSSTPRGLDWTGDAEYCAPWTFVGAPAVMLPAGFGKNGLPLGIQIVGRSNWPAWRIAKALGISAHHGWAKFDTVQAYYSLAGRDLEREIVPRWQIRRSVCWCGRACRFS
jgi:Amidase